MRKIINTENSVFLAKVLLIIVLLETAFENTPLQNYNLMINRFILIIEILIFIFLLSRVQFTEKGKFYLLLLLGIFICSYFIIHSSLLLKMLMMSLAVAKLGIEKSFEIIFKFKLVVIALVIGVSLIGIIPNEYIEVAKGIGVVHAYGLGYTHPNRLATSICTTILCFIGWKNDSLKKSEVGFLSIIAIIFFVITRSRTLLYCILIFLFFYMLNKFNGTHVLCKKIISLFGTISIPLCLGVSIVFPLLLLSSSGILQNIVYTINQLFSRRFTHIERMFLTYPVTLGGGLFDTSLMDDIFGYSVVDNGYIRFLYQYGILGLGLFSIMSILSFTELTKQRKFIWSLVFVIVAIEGLLENVYVDIGLNILVVFWALLIKDRLKVIK